MVITEQVEKTVDEQTLNFVMKSASIFSRLSEGCPGAYHYIAQQYRGIPRDLPEAVIHWKREYVCGPVYAPVKRIELFHPSVVYKQYPEFSSLEIE